MKKGILKGYIGFLVGSIVLYLGLDMIVFSFVLGPDPSEILTVVVEKPLVVLTYIVDVFGLAPWLFYPTRYLALIAFCIFTGLFLIGWGFKSIRRH